MRAGTTQPEAHSFFLRGRGLVKDYDDLDGLWKKLNESGLPKLWLPSRADFYKVDSFPLLGSGKLDLEKLKAQGRKLAGGEDA